MTTFSGAWSEQQVFTFLQTISVPIRLATHRPDGSLWVVALWYEYREGDFYCATGSNAQLVRYLEHDADVGFDVSTNDPPYRGVRGNGTTSVQRDEDKTVLRGLIERYLGDTDSPLARQLLSDDREELRIRVRPQEMYSWDYADRM